VEGAREQPFDAIAAPEELCAPEIAVCADRLHELGRVARVLQNLSPSSENPSGRKAARRGQEANSATVQWPRIG
jgi:hypothetical protein